MKKTVILFSFILFISGFVFSQTNSVALKTGTGTPISQHGSIQEAYNAITTPVTQAYLIEILTIYDGSLEVLPITFGVKDGSSMTNTITLRPTAGNTGEVITGTSTTGILILNDADYVIIDGRPGGVGSTPNLKLVNLSTSGTNANTIQLLNGASYNVIKYVHTINNTQNTAGPRAIVIGTTTTTANSNNQIRYCKVEGGRSGIGIAGSATIPNDSTLISNCEIFDWGYAGIWLVSGAANTNIDSCKIYQTIGVNNTLVSGIIASTVAGNTYNIRKNWIYDLQTTSTSTSAAIRGIYFAAPAAGSLLNIENNMISLPLDNLSSATHTGIELLGSTNAYTANVYYNTAKIGGIHTGGTAGNTTSAGIRVSSAVITLNMKNNIAINTRTGGNINHVGFALLNAGAALNIDYNCYYASNGPSNFHAYWLTTGYNTLSDYKTAATPNEQNSVFYNVNFISLTDLHVTGSSLGNANLKGTPITGITTDFDNNIRNSVAPYKGADEGNVPLFVISNPSVITNYELSQNYPNPFNPETNIKFAIPKSGYVSLKVFDIMGREVASLVNSNLENGEYEVSLDGSNLTSGIYFYQLKSGSFVDTKRMILLK